MDRSERLASAFIADEDLARGAVDLARAAESVDASFVEAKPVLHELASGPVEMRTLTSATGLSDKDLAVALNRLQDLQMITVSKRDGGQFVSLADAASWAAATFGS